MRMKLAALAGLFLALPIILWQIWRFVAPGLYSNEKRFAIPFVFLSTVFFTLGAAFSHYVAFPWTMQFFASLRVRRTWCSSRRISPVFAMYVKMMLAMGLVFEMPTAVFFLARIGLVTAGFLLRQFKYALLDHRHRRRHPDPGHRRRLAGADGRPDGRALMASASSSRGCSRRRSRRILTRNPTLRALTDESDRYTHPSRAVPARS